MVGTAETWFALLMNRHPGTPDLSGRTALPPARRRINPAFRAPGPTLLMLRLVLALSSAALASVLAEALSGPDVAWQSPPVVKGWQPQSPAQGNRRTRLQFLCQLIRHSSFHTERVRARGLFDRGDPHRGRITAHAPSVCWSGYPG